MPEKINLMFLGTAGSIPTARKNHTSILLTYKGENILIDCGEGTQRQFRKAKLNPCKITRILLTHKHADHSLGLIGLLKTMELSSYNKTLYIYGPKGTKSFMKKLFEAFGFIKEFKIEIKEVSGKFFETDDFFLEAEKMKHRVPCNAYSFVQKKKIKIDKQKLKKYKIPSGKHLQKLKQGKTIKYQGKKYKTKNLTFEESGKKITFIFDTVKNKNAVKIAKNSDVLISEATFSSELKNKAEERKHLTVNQAAEIAKKSKSKELILTHISQRHDKDLKKILKEVKKRFKNTKIAKDFDKVEI